MNERWVRLATLALPRTRWGRFKLWLARKLVPHVTVWARHGAHLHRISSPLAPELRIDMPLGKKEGMVDSPMGLFSTREVRAIIDEATVIEGSTAFPNHQHAYHEKACPFCGHTRPA